MVSVSLTVPPDVVLPDITTRTDVPSDTNSDSCTVSDEPLPGLKSFFIAGGLPVYFFPLAPGVRAALYKHEG